MNNAWTRGKVHFLGFFVPHGLTCGPSGLRKVTLQVDTLDKVLEANCRSVTLSAAQRGLGSNADEVI